MRSLSVLLVLVASVATATDANCQHFFQQKAVQQYVQPVVQAYVSPVQKYVASHALQYQYVQVAPQVANYSAGVEALHADGNYREYLKDRANYVAWLEMKVSESKKEELKSKPTLLAQKCGRCHGADLDGPKAGFRLLSEGNSDKNIVESLKQIKEGKMPPKEKLTPEDKGKLLEELLSTQEPASEE